MDNPKEHLLRKLPSISDLLAAQAAEAWLARHPRTLVTDQPVPVTRFLKE